MDTIVRTKVLIPRRREEILTRQRLLDLLDNFLDQKLIIVAAPAGYGKTSLLVDFTNTTRLPICWYALDPLDQDPRRFIAYIIASLKLRYPQFGKRSSGALQGMNQEQLNIDRVVSVMVNDIYENIPEHFGLVLDDYHLVEESKPVTQFINQFLQLCDENCHLFILSRTLLNLPDMPLLVARSQVGGLSFEELAFQPPEIQGLWAQNYNQAISEQEATKLAEETEGWITGLLLTNQMNSVQLAERLRVARVSGVDLYGYLARQVLERQPERTQKFLLRTSLLEEFDAPLCKDVIGGALGIEENWQELMAIVLQQNLFLLPLGEEGDWLRYHHLFRDFLQDRMATQFPEEMEKIRLALAEAYARRGDWESSYEVYKKLGRIDFISSLIKRAGNDLIGGGKIGTLKTWLDTVPVESKNNDPALVSLRGAVDMMQGETERGLRYLTQAIDTYNDNQDTSALIQSLVRRSSAYRLLGDSTRSLQDIEEALRLCSLSETQGICCADAIYEKAIIHFFQGQLDETLRCLFEAQKAYKDLGDIETSAKVSTQLGMVQKTLGQYADAEKTYLEALEYYQSSGNVIWQAELLNNLGVLQQVQGEFEKAAISFEKSIQYSRIGGYTRLEAYILASMGDLFRDLEATQEALEAYQQSRLIAIRFSDRFLQYYLELAEAVLAWNQKRPEKSQNLFLSAQRMAEASESQYQINLCRLEGAKLKIFQKNLGGDFHDLIKATQFFDEQGYRQERLKAHLYLMIFYWENKQITETEYHLNKLIHLSSEPGNLKLIAVPLREVRKAVEILQNDIQFEHLISPLIRSVDVFNKQIPEWRRKLRQRLLTVPLGSPRLVIHTLGKIQVKVNGRVVGGADWQTQTARDLFFLILAHPEGLTKEEIGEIMWPESSPAELKLRFKNTIYRLRRAAGKDVILFENEIYRFNVTLDFDEDVNTFQAELKRAQEAQEWEQELFHLRVATKTYRGDYLPELDEDWVLSKREYYRQSYLDASLKMVRILVDHQQFDSALQTCQKILEIDRCQEEGYRWGMKIYAAMGNRGGLVRQYETCKKVFWEELDTSPSDQTIRLFEKLIQSSGGN